MVDLIVGDRKNISKRQAGIAAFKKIVAGRSVEQIILQGRFYHSFYIGILDPLNRGKKRVGAGNGQDKKKNKKQELLHYITSFFYPRNR